MKKIKKIPLIVFVLLIFNVSLFAKGSFEAIVNVPIGMSFGGGNADGVQGKVGFDSGVNVKLGYMFIFNKWAFSILGDVGYSYDSYKIFNTATALGNTIDSTDSLYLHSFQLGVLPKFNFGAFSLGIGLGVKVPLALNHKYKRFDKLADGSQINTSHNETLYGNDISKLLKSEVIPYLKVTFEYSIYFNDKIAFNVGAYLGYDFNINKENIIYSTPLYDAFETKINTFDIGLQLGLRFAPKFNI